MRTGAGAAVSRCDQLDRTAAAQIVPMRPAAQTGKPIAHALLSPRGLGRKRCIRAALRTAAHLPAGSLPQRVVPVALPRSTQLHQRMGVLMADRIPEDGVIPGVHHEIGDGDAHWAAALALAAAQPLYGAFGHAQDNARRIHAAKAIQPVVFRADLVERVAHFSSRSLLSSRMKVSISLNWRYTEAKRT